MSEVREIASLHPTTVQKVAKGEVKRDRRRRGRITPPVVTVREEYHPLLKAWLQENPPPEGRVVEYVSPTSALIRNAQ